MNSLVNVSCMLAMLLADVVRADNCESHWANAIGQPGMDHEVHAFAVFDDGSSPALYAGGIFISAGGETVNRIAKWDGAAWSPVGDGVTGGWVNALTVFDDGTGPALYAGGNFTHAGGRPAGRIAKWDGTTWSALGGDGTSHGTVRALAAFDDGSGPALYAGGGFLTLDGTNIKFIGKWDGAAWSLVGDDGVNDEVRALAVYDDGTGPALYVGGRFTIAKGPDNANPSGGCVDHCGFQAPEGCWCDEFCCSIGDCCANKCEACSGCDYITGTCLPGEYVYSIAKWDGTSWSSLDGGLSGSLGFPAIVNAVTVHNGKLIVGGNIVAAGSAATTANNIAKWDGTAWSPFGSGMSGNVHALASLDHGENASVLFAGGSFQEAGDNPASRIARWDGEDWSALGSGTSHAVLALTDFDSGYGTHLYVGGQFTTADGEAASRIASWHDCLTPPTCALADLNCDGVVDVSDLLMLLSAWGPCGSPCPADLNNDYIVDVSDLLILLNNWE